MRTATSRKSASESVGVRVGQKVELGPHMTRLEGWDDSLLVTPVGWFLSTDTQRSTVTMYCANRVVTTNLLVVDMSVKLPPPPPARKNCFLRTPTKKYVYAY